VLSFVFRNADGQVTSEMDRDLFGLFPRSTWLAWLHAEGFHATSRMDPWNRDIFIARRPL
jgi:hypothetical protein